MPRRSVVGKAPSSRRRRRFNIRRIKATWPYSVQEIAELFGVHKNTVLGWFKDGLQADRSQRPSLVRGDMVAAFLAVRQTRKRQPCAPDEFYCFKCRAPRKAYLRMVDIVIESPTRLRIKALCGVCDTPVNKVQSVRELAKIRECFEVQQLAGEHLLECPDPNLNRDLET